MRYYLDCEFNGMGGELLSLALVREDGVARELVVYNLPKALDPWVRENVVPKLRRYDGEWVRDTKTWAQCIEHFLGVDDDISIITDWPDDIRYFCELIITGPGKMIDVRPSIKFEMHRVDAYPTTLPGAVQHNAYWDAMALRHKLQGAEP